MKKILFILFTIPLLSIAQTSEIKFVSENEYEQSPKLELAPLQKATQQGFLDFAIKEETTKRKMQDYSDVKFTDIYTKNEDGTYTAKNKTYSTTGGNQGKNLIAENSNLENNNYNNYNSPNEYRSTLDEESIFLILKIGIVILFLIISEFLGRAKHIGRWWTFLLLLSGIIPGVIALITSPSAKKKPTQGVKKHTFFACIFLVIGILNTIILFDSKGKAGYLFYAYFLLSYYLFELFKGHIVNLNPKYYLDTKENNIKTNMASHEEIKSFSNITHNTVKSETNEKNLLQKILKFLKDDDKITLEIEFTDFESSIMVDFKAKSIPSELNSWKVYIVKNAITENVVFFFRDSPKFAFSLTIDELVLHNNINNTELKIEDFIVLTNEPIIGTRITITENMLAVNALVRNGTTLLGNSILSQYYFYATSFKNYNYQLDFKTLTETPKKFKIKTIETPNFKEKTIKKQPIETTGNNNNYSPYVVLVLLAFFIGLIIYTSTTKPKTNNSPQIESSSISIIPQTDSSAFVDSAATVVETNLVQVDTTANIIEDNNNSEVESSYFFGEWRGTELEFTFYSNGDIYLKLNDGTEYWKKWKFVDNELYIESDGTFKRLYILDGKTNSFGWRLEGTNNVLHFYRSIRKLNSSY